MAAFVGISPDLRAILAAHIAFQFMDWRCFRSPHDVEGNSLMRVAAEAFHFEIAIPGVDRVAERGRWLRRALKAEHAHVPSAACNLISRAPSAGGFFRCGPDGRAIDRLSRFG